MPDAMIERAARALMALDYPEEAGGEMGEFYMDRHGERYREQVRAVLTAMREPTEKMIEAGRAAVRDDGVTGWYDMIDAALAEEVNALPGRGRVTNIVVEAQSERTVTAVFFHDLKRR